ncbi:twitch domain-containing radical SAM protein [Bacteriovorax stolpii]|uniref:twitch domain-containing radical SAM protein n=1 Tax=Bacteriovorax stolpii TaxID=960 RepID=UPI00163C92F5|nr:twitch domain-containing radical SAM protein [Bacteriovorax stolpii]
MNALNKKHFCILPWIHLEIQQGGNCTTCCKTQLQVDLGQLNNTPLLDILNHSEQIQTRKNMLEDKPTTACSDCYRDEKLGHLSLRQRSNLYYSDYYDSAMANMGEDCKLLQPNLVYLGLRFSNLCNLKCVYCSSHYSTSIRDDYNVGHLKTFNSKKEMEFFLEEYCKNVETYYIAGGEPFLDPLHLDFLKHLVSNNLTQTNLTYNTNLSIPLEKREDLFDLWKTFKSVIFCASLDASHSTGEKIRVGLKWEMAEKNIKIVSEKLGIDKIKIYITVTNLNALEICSFIDYLIKKKLCLPNGIIFNFLSSPLEYHIGQIDQNIKNTLSEEIRNFRKRLLLNYDLNDVHTTISQLNSFLKYL